ncbi:MAG TPA: metalloregulator ArsR/SmtB family transcription factor [Planctomycetota bacterium]|jgi:DNA-binding transcriptional ArsR family regulator
MRQFMNITKALADENRARTVMFLRHGELCLCQIIEMLQLAPSTVSKHMAILQQAGLVEHRKDGRWRYYRLPGKSAPMSVRSAVGWVIESLGEEPKSAEDDKRLKAVMKRDIQDLCALYRS